MGSEMPERWKKVKLGDVAIFNYGKGLPEQKRISGSIPVYSSAGITGWHNTALVESKGIIIGRKGTVGKVYYSNEPFFCIDTAYYIEPNEKNYDFRFLYYLLLTIGLEDLNEDSAVPGLNRNTAYSQYIFFPPLPEQHAIASVLSSLDDKIDLLHRQNRTLEAMAETLFRQWFVEEKEDWEEGILGDVIELFDHLRIPLSKMERNKKKNGQLYPYYGAAKVMDFINDYIFDGDYILLGEDGTVRTDKGYPVLQYATGKFWVNNHAHVIKAKPPYNNFFLWNYLSKKNIDKIVTGAVQPKINQGNLKALDFPKSPEDLVVEFNEQTKPFFKKMNQNNTQIHTLEKLRDTLLPKLMSGEVRMKVELSNV